MGAMGGVSKCQVGKSTQDVLESHARLVGLISGCPRPQMVGHRLVDEDRMCGEGCGGRRGLKHLVDKGGEGGSDVRCGATQR
jgi:hypothetical protein